MKDAFELESCNQVEIWSFFCLMRIRPLLALWLSKFNCISKTNQTSNQNFPTPPLRESCQKNKTILIPSSCSHLDCSQPPIFSYFQSIVEIAERIARELHASAKDLTGWGWDREKKRGCRHLWREANSLFLQKRKIPIG